MGRLISLSILICILAGSPAKAQHFFLSPEFGYERTAYHIGCDHHDGISSKTGNGFRIGVGAAYRFNNDFSLRTGLFYSHRGGGQIYDVYNRSNLSSVRDIELNRIDFLTLPITVGYEIPFSGNWGIGVEAGGYIASGIGAGSSYFRCINGEGSAGSVFDHSSFTIGNENGSDRTRVTVKGSDRIDAGPMFGAHIRYGRIRFKASYQLGLCKTLYDMAMPRTFIITLAYDFRR